MKRNIVLILTVAAIVFAYTMPVSAKIIDRSDVSVGIEASDALEPQALDTSTPATNKYTALRNVLTVLAYLMLIVGTFGALLPVQNSFSRRLFLYTDVGGLLLIIGLVTTSCAG